MSVTCDAIEASNNGKFKFDQERCKCYKEGSEPGCNEAKAVFDLVQSGYCTQDLTDYYEVVDCNQLT